MIRGLLFALSISFSAAYVHSRQPALALEGTYIDSLSYTLNITYFLVSITPNHSMGVSLLTSRATKNNLILLH